MKTMKKLCALLLALAMLFCLTACQGVEDQILGKWVCKLDIAKMMDKLLTENFGEAVELPEYKLEMAIIFDFTKNGEMTLSAEIDQDGIAAMVEDLANKLWDYLVAEAEKNGLSADALEAMFQAQEGKTFKDYLNESIEEMKEGLNEEMNIEPKTFYYRIDEKNDRIYISDEKEGLNEEGGYLEFSLEKSVMTINAIAEEGQKLLNTAELEEYGITLPMVFEKQ